MSGRWQCPHCWPLSSQGESSTVKNTWPIRRKLFFVRQREKVVELFIVFSWGVVTMAIIFMRCLWCPSICGMFFLDMISVNPYASIWARLCCNNKQLPNLNDLSKYWLISCSCCLFITGQWGVPGSTSFLFYDPIFWLRTPSGDYQLLWETESMEKLHTDSQSFHQKNNTLSFYSHFINQSKSHG